MEKLPTSCDERLQAIAQYYDDTWADYRWLWLNDENRAIHFGYEDAKRVSHAASLVATNRALADLANIQSGERVLDAGCGIGGSSLWLAAELGATVFGITPVRTQVKLANAAANARQLCDLVKFKQADYAATGFPDASFDVVWALESLCHAEEKISFYHESARILRPGGRLVIAEYLRTERQLSPTNEELLKE